MIRVPSDRPVFQTVRPLSCEFLPPETPARGKTEKDKNPCEVNEIEQNRTLFRLSNSPSSVFCISST